MPYAAATHNPEVIFEVYKPASAPLKVPLKPAKANSK